jgi:hypothetical protein
MLCGSRLDQEDLAPHIYWHYDTSDHRWVAQAITEYLVALQKKIEEDL